MDAKEYKWNTKEIIKGIKNVDINNREVVDVITGCHPYVIHMGEEIAFKIWSLNANLKFKFKFEISNSKFLKLSPTSLPRHAAWIFLITSDLQCRTLSAQLLNHRWHISLHCYTLCSRVHHHWQDKTLFSSPLVNVQWHCRQPRST